MLGSCSHTQSINWGILLAAGNFTWRDVIRNMAAGRDDTSLHCWPPCSNPRWFVTVRGRAETLMVTLCAIWGRGDRKLRKCGIDALVIYHAASRWQVRQGPESKNHCTHMRVAQKFDQRVKKKKKKRSIARSVCNLRSSECTKPKSWGQYLYMGLN